MKKLFFGFITLVCSAAVSHAVIVFEAAGSTPASISPTRDAFRNAIGGGNVAGANGDFGGVRREINWDGVPAGLSDPTPFPGNFFNATSPRGAVFSTPGTGLLVSGNAGVAAPILFGFSSDFQAFSAQKLFTAIGSNIVDVSFFLPGTNSAATTTAFGLIFTDVEVSGSTRLQFFDAFDNLLFSRDALVSGNQGLTFLGGVMDANEAAISRVRITSGANTILANGFLGDPNNDVVAMDDFIYATPGARAANVPDAGSTGLLVGALILGFVALRRRSATIAR